MARIKRKEEGETLMNGTSLKVTHTNEWKYGGSFVPTKIRG